MHDVLGRQPWLAPWLEVRHRIDSARQGAGTAHLHTEFRIKASHFCIMSVMQTDLKYCSECHGPLIEIDYYGLRLIGCIECNCWGWQAAMEVAEEDMDALRERVRRAKRTG